MKMISNVYLLGWLQLEKSFEDSINEAYENRKHLNKIRNGDSTLKIDPQKNKLVEILNKIMSFFDVY